MLGKYDQRYRSVRRGAESTLQIKYFISRCIDFKFKKDLFLIFLLRIAQNYLLENSMGKKVGYHISYLGNNFQSINELSWHFQDTFLMIFYLYVYLLYSCSLNAPKLVIEFNLNNLILSTNVVTQHRK